jgi:hypothetical protein
MMMIVPKLKFLTYHFISRAIDEALERLEVLLALRRASEASLQGTREIIIYLR